MAELARAHLIDEHTPARYTFHDLLRTYAGEQTHSLDPDDQRHTATHRMLDHYLHTADSADRLLDPHRDRMAMAPPQPGVQPEDFADYGQAWAWCEADYPVLLAAVAHAADTRLDTHAWQITWTLATFFERRGHWHAWLATARIALAAAQRLGNRDGQGRTHLSRARAYALLGTYEDAHPDLRRALDLFRQLGDLVQQAHAHYALSWVFEHQGRRAEALDHAHQALDLYRSAGHRIGQADALNNIGWNKAQLGDYRHALTYCQQALAQHQKLGHRLGEAHTWDSVAYAHHHLGHHTQAIACYQRALALYRDLHNSYYEAGTLARLGDTHHAIGDTEAARATWEEALHMLDNLHHPDADQVRTKLRDLDQTPTAASLKQCSN